MSAVAADILPCLPSSLLLESGFIYVFILTHILAISPLVGWLLAIKMWIRRPLMSKILGYGDETLRRRDGSKPDFKRKVAPWKRLQESLARERPSIARGRVQNQVYVHCTSSPIRLEMESEICSGEVSKQVGGHRVQTKKINASPTSKHQMQSQYNPVITSSKGI